VLTVATGTPALVAAQEINCDDCVDDDQDGDIDREDSECPPPAGGGLNGLVDLDAAKAITKCQKGLQKAGSKFASAKLKALQKCANAAFKCVQLKNGDAACAAKARAVCQKALNLIPALEDKLEAGIVKACGPDKGVAFADLEAVDGLGFLAEEGAVTIAGCGPLDSIQDLAACVRIQHECKVERILASGVPRIIELLNDLGLSPAADLPCLETLAGSAANAQGLPTAVQQKAAVKCQALITKGGAKVVSALAKAIQTCVDGVFKCIQTKPGDDACLLKATAKCQKLNDKLRNFSTGTIAKLASKTTAGCEKAGLSAADLRSALGLGFDALEQRCDDLSPFLGVATISQAVTCVGVNHLCDGVQMIQREVPRARTLAGEVGIDLP
jgi:hypothetical protein